ncbi:MAG: cysteine--tRNA ligase [Candidatus Babeliales bacterium]
MLKITNTLTGKKEPFKPLSDKKVLLYVCGITPYDFAHMGHGRVYVFFDVLYRLLRLLGYDVTYCRNFTDVDDKLIARAQKEYNDPLRFAEIATRFIDAYHEDMARLNCLPPTYEPRVTAVIPEIIKFIEGLIAKGKAYVVDGDVYFRIKSFPEYTKLSKQNSDDLKAGARVQVDEHKEDPLDFALWKAEKEGTFWKSPWGYGRPGWHIECSAMAQKYLGDRIDIHGGGMDLIFPHHENEIAQTEGLTEKPFANYWMHNAFVRINKEKMSKSLGNFFTLRDVFKQFDPMVVRFLYLNHHYRAPLDFSLQELEVAQKTYQKLAKFFAQTICKKVSDQDILKNPLVQEMLAFLYDDVNTTGLWGVLFSNLDALQKDQETFCAVKQFIMEVLGLTLEPLPEQEVTVTSEMQKLIAQREEARKQKDWARADALRDELRKLGYDTQDKKS